MGFDVSLGNLGILGKPAKVRVMLILTKIALEPVKGCLYPDISL